MQAACNSIQETPAHSTQEKPGLPMRATGPSPVYALAMALDALDGLVARLREGGVRITTARRLVLRALVDGPSHPTAEELLTTIRTMAPDVHASTVYRNLEELERLGVVVHTHLGHGPATYHLAAEAHGHLVCERCGLALEAPSDLVDQLARGTMERLGFILRPYHFAVLGICSRCAQPAEPG